MGLFSNEKKIEVSVELQRAIPDNMIPDTTITQTVKAIQSNGVISEFLADGWMNSIGTRANRMYKYAQKWHPYGMPVSNLHSVLDSKAIVKQVIEAELGRATNIGYFHLAPFNATHHAWKTLVDEYGYSSQTNEIKVLSQRQKVPVYLKDIIPIYAESDLADSPAGSQEVWGLPAQAYPYPGRMATPASLAQPTPVEIDLDASESIVRIVYVFTVNIVQMVGSMEVSLPEIREGVIDLPLRDFSLDSEWYQVELKHPSTGLLSYWSYQVGSGVYPELEAAQDAVFNDLGTYFPLTYFRYDFQAETTARQEYSDPYEDQKKMLNYLNMDYDAVGDGINANPGIENIVHAFMMFGVAPGSEDPTEQKYLYEYFNALWYATGAKNPTFDPSTPSLSDRRFSVTDKRFSMSFGYKAVVKRSVGGKIGKVGAYSGSFSNRVYTYRYQRTAAMYDEIEVHDLLLNYRVYKGYGYTGGAGSKALLIPLDKALLGQFNAKEREVLIARSMHYVMCSYVETEVKWYSKGWFKIVIIIIAIVISCFTGPGGAAVAAALTSATVAAVAWAVMVVLFQAIILPMLMQYAFSMVAKAVGAEIAMIMAVVLIIYGGYTYVSETPGLLNVSAQQLVEIGSNMVKAANSVQQEEILKIQNEMTEFSLIAEQKWEELEDVKNLLGKEGLIDPFAFIGQEPRITFGEEPDTFYDRTVHTGNIGTLSFDSISSYANISLTLPKLPQNIGETDNELV